jgi:hypothetical protein
MKIKHFYLGFFIGIAGCYSPIRSDIKIIEPLDLPRPSIYIDSISYDNKTNLSNYRDALVGYQKYLHSYIINFETIYNLPPHIVTKDPIECPIEIELKPLVVSKAPDIPNNSSSDEINNILFDYIKLMRHQINEYNRDINTTKKLINKFCK